VITIFTSIDWFSPAYKAGGPITSIVNLVNSYGSENINFKIFTSNNDLNKEKLEIQADIWAEYNSHTLVCYSSDANRSIRSVIEEIKKSKPDILFINGLYSLYFNLAPLLFGKAPIKVLSPRGMLHPGALSQKRIKKYLYLKLLRLTKAHRRCTFHACNEEEKLYIYQHFGTNVRVCIAENFPRQFKEQSNYNKQKGSLSLITVALISPMKNYLHVLQALRSCKDTITYHIYGPIKDKEYWDLCLKEIKQLPHNINVIYHKDIPPFEVESALENAHVYIQPSKSENYGHSFIEALSAGKPVITSNSTPWNNLNNNMAGINLDPENISQITKSIDFFAAMDINDFKKWSAGAVDYSKKAVDIKAIQKQYNELFQI
jgi:glycosyltransferase involved in cell wall biosynthesis